MTNSNIKRGASLSVFALTMITIGSVDSIRNLPTAALFGSSVIFYFILGAITFLIPAALVSAELASSFPGKGGVYAWVREAFGKKVGFLAVWFQWVENIIWYPTMLAFIAGTAGFFFAPDLASSKAFIIATVLVVFWGVTLINLMGIKTSARFATWCGLSGLLLPMAVIIGLGVSWVVGHHPMQVQFTADTILPNHGSSDTWMAFIGIMLSFCGIEITGVHASDVRDPQRDFPKALFYASVIIMGTLMLGALSIAIVVPHDQLNLLSGMMQAFSAFFTAYHVAWMIPVMMVLLVVGSMGSLNNWVIAPTRGLLFAGRDGQLPHGLQKTNNNGAPVSLLLYQAIIATIVTMAFLLMPSVNGSYWLLTALAGQLYMFMYIIMFAAALYIRFRDKNQKPDARAYRAPGGLFGITIVCLLGIASTVGAVVVGFIPPTDVPVGGTEHFEILLISGLLLMSLPPFILNYFQRPTWLSANPA